ncbi:hypothetical protein RB195_014580 [Necator americanus]|uniref:Uncharacterized protein n=1 Tax=Necator americanus TaxID=51031 RepID=A0ABR1E0V6_NECAM
MDGWVDGSGWRRIHNCDNIAVRHGAVDGKRCEEDGTSLKFVERVELALVTENGRKYMERHEHRVLVFEDTFNVTRDAFDLAN